MTTQAPRFYWSAGRPRFGLATDLLLACDIYCLRCNKNGGDRLTLGTVLLGVATVASRELPTRSNSRYLPELTSAARLKLSHSLPHITKVLPSINGTGPLCLNRSPAHRIQPSYEGVEASSVSRREEVVHCGADPLEWRRATSTSATEPAGCQPPLPSHLLLMPLSFIFKDPNYFSGTCISPPL